MCSRTQSRVTPVGHLDQHQSAVADAEGGGLGDHDVHRPLRGQRVGRLVDDLGEPSLAVWVVVTTTVRAPTSRSIAPPTPSTGLPGTAQLAIRPVRVDLQGAEHGDVDVAAADHPERGGAGEVGGAGAGGDRLLAGVHQVGVGLAGAGGGADAEQPVLGLQGDRVQRQVVGDVGGDADAEVDDGAGRDVRRRRGRRSVPGGSCGTAFARPDRTSTSTNRCGVTMASGSRAPTGTISSTSAITRSAAVAMSGLKLRAVLA